MVRPAARLIALACIAASALPGAAEAAADARIETWELPARGAAAQPSLVASGDSLHLSWIEPTRNGHSLRYARQTKGRFGAASTIARGEDWFVNWADFPSMAALPDGTLATFFLQKSAALTYAYDVRLIWSTDGSRWSAPRTVHDDATPSEHGFVSMWAWSQHELGIAWLDGRHTGGGGADHAHHQGAMTLRAAVMARDGKRNEWELDARTCDCCQTDAALTASGPVLVYRDRSPDEIRDIAITRFRDGAWTPPRTVHDDGWLMRGCPVNGPAVAAHGEEIHVAWFTLIDGEPLLRLARSDDDGRSFDPPVTLDSGAGLLGRVDLVRDAQHVYVSWLRETSDSAGLQLSRLPAGATSSAQVTDVARLARGNGSGFPRMALHDGWVHLVWTDIRDHRPELRGARIRFDSVAEPPAP